MLRAMYDNMDLDDRRVTRAFISPWLAAAGGQGSTVNASGTSHPFTGEIREVCSNLTKVACFKTLIQFKGFRLCPAHSRGKKRSRRP
jgi:hypothetical protein